MPPGFVCVLKTSHTANEQKAALDLDQLLVPNDLFDSCGLADFNHALFRCEEEERDFSQGKRGCYGLSHRKLEYAGLMSIVHILEKQQILMNMGHPLFDNMR